MTTEYLPAPGVVAAYVVGFLHSLAIGTEVDTGTISEAIAQSIPAIISGTGAAVSHGLVVREKVGNRYLWRRGPTQVSDAFIAEHAPKVKVNVDPTLRATLEAAAAARPPAPYVGPPAVELPPPTVSLREQFAEPRVIPDDLDEHPVLVIRKAIDADKAAAAAAAPEPAPAARRASAPAPRLRVGIWSDGSLHVEREGRLETYTPSEALQLLRFLDATLLRGRDVAVA